MSAERPAYRSDIQGLRGVAILLVVAYHAGVASLAGGYVGVDVFFVISGYLITGLLARELEATGDIDLIEFYARRARRLLPAFIVVLLTTLLAVLWLYAPIDQPLIADNARAVALHAGNVVFARDAINYHASDRNPLLHTWSLAVEEQFYVVWPLMFVFLARVKPGARSIRRVLVAAILVAAAISLLAAVIVTRIAQPWAFFGMPTRIWEFAVGGLIALTLQQQSRIRGTGLLQAAGLAAIVVSTLVYHDVTPYPGLPALVPVLGAGALLVGGVQAPASLVARTLDARPLQWLGRVSYSWYLWHWPLVGIGVAMNWQIGVGGKLLWSLAALGLAELTYRFIEEPARRGTLLRDRPHLFNATALGVTLGAALLAHVAFSAAKSNATAPAQRQFVAARNDGMPHDCWGSLLENATAPCEFGDLGARTTVVLMGDSHAEHWLPALDAIGRARGWKVVALVKPGCPVADVPELASGRLKRTYDECTNWRRSRLRRIITMHPSAVVLSSYNHYVAHDKSDGPTHVSPESWGNGLRRTYAALSSAGIRTIAMRDVPQAGFDVPSCLSRHATGTPWPGPACVYTRADGLVPEAIMAQNDAARGLRRIAIVDMNDRVCPRSPCSAVQNGAVVFRDDDHLTATFSRAQATVLGDRIEAALRSMR